MYGLLGLLLVIVLLALVSAGSFKDQDKDLKWSLLELRRFVNCQDRVYKSGKEIYRDYWVLENYIMAGHGPLSCYANVTYTTHADYRYLDNVVPLLERWRAPQPGHLCSWRGLWAHLEEHPLPAAMPSGPALGPRADQLPFVLQCPVPAQGGSKGQGGSVQDNGLLHTAAVCKCGEEGLVQVADGSQVSREYGPKHSPWCFPHVLRPGLGYRAVSLARPGAGLSKILQPLGELYKLLKIFYYLII